MQKLKQTLPNMNAVLAFEAAGRHVNFTKAADELNVSRVAVSQHVRTLEAQLGVRLFERGGRRLVLTDAGREYHKAVTAAFGALLSATQSVVGRRAERSVSVAASSAFSTYWLMNKIGRFQEANPDFDVHVIVSESLWRESDVDDLPIDEVDIVIRYGEGIEEGRDHEVLFEDAIYPICSPGYLASAGQLRSIEELASHRLLHLEGPYADVHKWPGWLLAHDLSSDILSDAVRMTLNTYAAIIQAAIDGHGIALLSAPMLSDQLKNGALQLAVETAATSWLSFYVSCNRKRIGAPAVAALRRELLKDAREVVLKLSGE